MPARDLLRVTCAAILAMGCVAASAAPPPSSLAFSLVPLQRFDSGLDAGGEVGYSALLLSLAATRALDRRASLGLRLSLDAEDWRFDRPLGFDGVDPWGQILRVGVSLPYRFTTESGWSLGLTPTIESSGETGARFADTIEYGATLSAARAVRPDLTLGVGIGVFERIDETRAFPYVVVDWRIDERWRLANPFAASPAGPAGLELSYRFDGGWTAGLGAAYRSYRHRLDTDGPIPGGIGEHRFVPVFVQLSRPVTESLSINLYAGAALATRLRVEDAAGQRLHSEDVDPAEMLGISLFGRF